MQHFIEYIALRCVVFVLAVLPQSRALSAGRMLGRLAAFLLKKRRRIARANLQASFAEMTDEQADRTTARCWQNLGQGLAEFARIPRLSEGEYRQAVRASNFEAVKESHKKGRGVVLTTAHYGSWECGSRILPLAGMRTAVIARRIKNPYVDAYVTRVRETGGVRVIPARSAVRESIRWLKGGNVLVMLIDQRITDGGLQVPFFGRPAFTTSLPAILALRYDVPVHSARVFRQEGKIDIEFGPALDFSQLEKNEAGILQATLKMNAIVEAWVRERPELWLWIHNRWKQ